MVQLVETLRAVMKADDLPVWAKRFLSALIVFGLLILMSVLVILLVEIVQEVSTVGRYVLGRALMLTRLFNLGKMSQLTARCMGNQLCRKLGQWLSLDTARLPTCCTLDS